MFAEKGGDPRVGTCSTELLAMVATRMGIEAGQNMHLKSENHKNSTNSFNQRIGEHAFSFKAETRGLGPLGCVLYGGPTCVAK